MLDYLRIFIIWFVACAVLGTLAPSSRADMSIHLILGAVGDDPGGPTDPDADDPDIDFESGILSTADDGMMGTTGNQNTAVEFENFPVGSVSNILTATASFTLDGLTPWGPATAIYGTMLVGQEFTGGSLALYNEANELLLSGNLTVATINGTLAPPGKQGFFGAFGIVTGGSLAPLVIGNEKLFVSMKLPTINECNANNVCEGFSMTPEPVFPLAADHVGELEPFIANAFISIQFRPIPEPSSMALVWIALGLMGAGRTKRG